ncbi:hypothetical protein [Rhizorhapis sp.]|uniref:hypothetical protein n=1 Tax=Rhizorhapis sp. TaxID=1968842 RepID=UPI002B4705BA|nr:hypothetical protein [Rhizorhapis sp.]HKR17665.1 hypothetical protein [Rhizorhapis sp.]
MAAKYTDTITTDAGTALEGATVELLTGAGALVTTYTDDALTQNAATSRTTDANGLVELYVADGTYSVRTTYNGVVKTLANVELYDISTIASTSSGAVANKAQASAVGISGSAENMGTYTGSTIPDNETAKQNIQSLETAVETKARADAVGITSSATNMGIYTSPSLTDNQTAKQNIEELGGAVDARPTSATLAATGGAALIGTADFSGTTIPNGSNVQQAMQALETAVELRATSAALAAAGGSALIGHQYSGTGSTLRTTAAVINDLGLNVKGYGALGDGSTNDYTHFTDTLAQCVATGAPMFIPPGDYLWDLTSVGTASWDVTRTVRGAKRAIPIIGAGLGQTSIHITNGTSIAWQIASSSDWFDLTLEGFTVYGAMDIPLLVIGKNDYSDPVNMMAIKNVSVENSYNGTGNEAVRLNYITGGEAINLRCNSYSNGSGTNKGSALRIRQGEFLSFVGGAAGNAARGVDFTDGVSFGCTFIGQTYENSDYCFSNRSANSGAHTVMGSQFSNVATYAIYSSASLSGEPLTFIGNNYTPSGALVDPSNYSGVRIVHSRSVSTPSLPASTVAATNTTGHSVMVYIWGGTVTAVTVDGFAFGLTSGVFIVQPGSTIAVTYSVAPSWQWRNMQA